MDLQIFLFPKTIMEYSLSLNRQPNRQEWFQNHIIISAISFLKEAQVV